MKRFVQIIAVAAAFVFAVGIADARVAKDISTPDQPTIKTIEDAAAGTSGIGSPDFCKYIVQEKFGDDGNSFDVDCKCLDTCFDSVKTSDDNEICINIEERCMAQR